MSAESMIRRVGEKFVLLRGETKRDCIAARDGGTALMFPPDVQPKAGDTATSAITDEELSISSVHPIMKDGKVVYWHADLASGIKPPVVNTIHVREMHGGAIQQGSPGASQIVRTSNRTREPAAALLASILPAIQSLPIGAPEKEELVSLATTAKVLDGGTSKDKESLISGCLGEIKQRLQVLAGDATIAGIALASQPIIARIQDWLS
jgi:hypothetical protein